MSELNLDILLEKDCIKGKFINFFMSDVTPNEISNFDFKSIEKKWQKLWYDNNIYQAIDNDTARPKKYVLTEFPFPSGASLHVGHCFRFTVPDVYSRYFRMKGYNVMFPMGYDSFGLPTEEKARKDGKNPKVTTTENIASIREGLKSMGYSFDWDREFATTDESYYKWTQWIFGEMYKAGLVEQREVELWWCPAMSTVLANEEVIEDPNGSGMKVSERGEHPVEKKKMNQWVIKITDYADKLIDGLDTIPWPEHIKEMQRNWIGKSEGATVKWKVEGKDIVLETFTTRVDTLPAVSFLAIAPESDILSKLVTDEHRTEVEKYVDKVKNKSERDRQINKEKTGLFTGSYAKNPLTGEVVPIWTADYVLSGYGTGCVMGVAGHDERDFEFASDLGLEIKFNIKPKNGELDRSEVYIGDGVLFDSGEFDGMEWRDAKNKITTKLEQEDKGKSEVNYKFRDWVFSRQRYWGEPFPFEYIKLSDVSGEQKEEIIKQVGAESGVVSYTEIGGEQYLIRLLPKDELPLVLPEVADYEPSNDGRSPLAKTDWINIKDDQGKLVGKRESDTMPNWAGSSWYFLRYTDPKNDKEFASQDKLKYWLPIDHYFGGNEHTTLHLLYSRFWHRFLYDQDQVPTEEPYYMRTNGGILLAEDGTKMSKSKGNVINPQEKIDIVGTDALRLYINFIGPYNAAVVWQEGGLKACSRLVESIWNLRAKVRLINTETEKKVLSAYHKMVKKVGSDIEELKSNVAVAEIMTFTNLLKQQENISGEVWEGFIKVLAPFAPHLAEELWYELNGFEANDFGSSIHLSDWPTYDPEMCIDETVTIVVQINGKVRGEFEAQKDTSENELLEKAKNLETVQKWLEGKEIKFTKVIPNKMVTLAVG